MAQRQLSRAAGTLVALQPGSHSVLEGWSQEEITYPGGGKLEEAVWLLKQYVKLIVLHEVGYKTVCVLSSMDI